MPKLKIVPVTKSRWSDFEKLFGVRGACGGCWCMWWRLRRSVYDRQKGEGNKSAMREIIEAGKTPGLLAYVGKEPVAWCSVAPRSEFPVLDRSRNLKPIDDQDVWSVVCFFVAKENRKQGITVALLQAAIDYVTKKGGKIVEGYPVVPKNDEMPAPFAWTGIHSAFQKAGFVECLRRSETRPIMRHFISAKSRAH